MENNSFRLPTENTIFPCILCGTKKISLASVAAGSPPISPPISPPYLHQPSCSCPVFETSPSPVEATGSSPSPAIRSRPNLENHLPITKKRPTRSPEKRTCSESAATKRTVPELISPIKGNITRLDELLIEGKKKAVPCSNFEPQASASFQSPKKQRCLPDSAGASPVVLSTPLSTRQFLDPQTTSVVPSMDSSDECSKLLSDVKLSMKTLAGLLAAEREEMKIQPPRQNVIDDEVNNNVSVQLLSNDMGDKKMLAGMLKSQSSHHNSVRDGRQEDAEEKEMKRQSTNNNTVRDVEEHNNVSVQVFDGQGASDEEVAIDRVDNTVRVVFKCKCKLTWKVLFSGRDIYYKLI